jgi:hypothetical protein
MRQGTRRARTQRKEAQFWILTIYNSAKGIASLALTCWPKTFEAWRKRFTAETGNYYIATNNKGIFTSTQTRAADAPAVDAVAGAVLMTGNEFRPYTLLCIYFDFIMELIKEARITIEDRMGVESTEHRLWTTVTHLATADFINADTSQRDTNNLAFLVVEAFALTSTILAKSSKLANASVSPLQDGGVEMSGDYIVDKYADSLDISA